MNTVLFGDRKPSVMLNLAARPPLRPKPVSSPAFGALEIARLPQGNVYLTVRTPDQPDFHWLNELYQHSQRQSPNHPSLPGFKRFLDQPELPDSHQSSACLIQPGPHPKLTGGLILGHYPQPEPRLPLMSLVHHFGEGLNALGPVILHHLGLRKAPFLQRHRQIDLPLHLASQDEAQVSSLLLNSSGEACIFPGEKGSLALLPTPFLLQSNRHLLPAPRLKPLQNVFVTPQPSQATRPVSRPELLPPSWRP